MDDFGPKIVNDISASELFFVVDVGASDEPRCAKIPLGPHPTRNDRPMKAVVSLIRH